MAGGGAGVLVASGVAAAAAEKGRCSGGQLHSCSQKLEGAATACSLPAERHNLPPNGSFKLCFWHIIVQFIKKDLLLWTVVCLQ